MENVQQKLSGSLSSNGGMLKQTQNMFDKNTEKVAQNLKEMDERLKKLGKWANERRAALAPVLFHFALKLSGFAAENIF